MKEKLVVKDHAKIKGKNEYNSFQPGFIYCLLCVKQYDMWIAQTHFKILTAY